MTKSAKKEQTSFGFKTVDSDKKASMVAGVFDSVASRYDIMNDLMSGGLHRLWKKQFVSEVNLFDGAKILDIAGGTGDIAFRIRDKAKEKGVNVDITVSDINPNMLEEGKARAIDGNMLSGLDWKVADAENLPFDDLSFDFCTIAFGIRNVTNIPKALKDINRVLKPGGRFLCLEFSHIDNKVLSQIYDSYSFNVIPKIGSVVAGDADSYQYLVESIRKFPKREVFSEMIKEAGFEGVTAEPLTKGVVAIHSGWQT